MKVSEEVKKLAFTITIFWVFMGVCALFYCTYENWTVSESFFFTVVTMTTVGYGYKVPKDDSSRLFTIFVMIFGVFFVFASINNAVATRLKKMRKEYLKAHDEISPTELYRTHQKRLFRTFFFIVAFLFIAAGIFCAMEDWTFITALYFAVQTATTVGFGDMDLRRGGTNVVLGIYIMLSTTLIFFAFNNFTTLHEEFRQIKQSAALAEKRQTLAKLKELDTGNGVTMDTFILAVLEQTGTIDRKKDIEPWIRKFREMDKDKNGTIDSHEIEEFSQAEAARAAQNLADIRAVTGGSRSVAIATLQDITTNFADALHLPLLSSTSTAGPSQRTSQDEGDVHMLTSPGASSNSSVGNQRHLVAGSASVNSMHAQRVAKEEA